MDREHVLRVTIHDCHVDTFKVSGSGGQRRDKVATGVRITHRPSGATGRATESRRQIDNKRVAFRRMGESQEFQAWARRLGSTLPSPETAVDQAMAEDNLLVEVRRGGVWVRL